jgi:large subunit ribosomal protein L29
MNIESVRSLSVEELDEALADARDELFNLRFQMATNQLTNTAQIGDVRRSVARILTVIREKEEGAR